MFDLSPQQLHLPGVPVPRRDLQDLADAQRAFLSAFEHYQRLRGEFGMDAPVQARFSREVFCG